MTYCMMSLRICSPLGDWRLCRMNRQSEKKLLAGIWAGHRFQFCNVWTDGAALRDIDEVSTPPFITDASTNLSV